MLYIQISNILMQPPKSSGTDSGSTPSLLKISHIAISQDPSKYAFELCGCETELQVVK